MTCILAFLLVSAQPSIPGRPYHRLHLDQIATSSATHVFTCGLVVYSRRQRDGDVHLTLADGSVRVVLEIIPLIPLDPPRKGQTIEAWGISRYDKRHKFTELHPLEGWRAVDRCQ